MCLKIISAVMLLTSLLSHAGVEAPDYFQRKNLIGKDFGLERKEIVLTFDDGPGPQTLRLLKVFLYHKIPATFFFVGNSIKKFPKIAEESLKIIRENPDLFSVGNHTKNHVNLYAQNLEGVGKELVWAHEILLKGHVKNFMFFRAPYGNFNPKMANFLNTDSSYADFSADYIGPVFWDMGGFFDAKLSNGKYVGDWSCWAKPLKTKILEAQLDPVKFCADGHFREILRLGNDEKRKSGIILLAHDFHVSTVNMFIGSTDVNEKGELINEDRNSLLYKMMNLTQDGFSFVGLDKSPDHLDRLLRLPQ